MSRALLVAVALSCSQALACSEGQGGGPAPLPSEDPGTPPAGTSNPPPATKRTVFERNPFGNVAASDNLLWDGDFEFRPSFPEQYGWLLGSGVNVGFGLPTLVIGARCRSGIKCAELAPGELILGMAVASAGNDLAVAFWAHPAPAEGGESGACEALRAVFSDQNFGLAQSQPIDAPPEPEADGWCHYELLSPARTTAAYLVIENVSDAAVVVDDATVRPAGAGQTARSSRKLSASEEARLDRLKESARRARQPRRDPPSAGERALEAHMQRLAR